jgi:hypothetical protein
MGVRIIDSFAESPEGYSVVVALLNPIKKQYQTGKLFWKKTHTYEENYVLLPVLFWATMYVVSETKNGESRGNSVLVPMVRVGDGVEAGPTIDGYITTLSPYEDDVESAHGVRNAINEWREKNIEVLLAHRGQLN